MLSLVQLTSGSGCPSALQVRLTVVPALTRMLSGPELSNILADSSNVIDISRDGDRIFGVSMHQNGRLKTILREGLKNCIFCDKQ